MLASTSYSRGAGDSNFKNTFLKKVFENEAKIAATRKPVVRQRPSETLLERDIENARKRLGTPPSLYTSRLFKEAAASLDLAETPVIAMSGVPNPPVFIGAENGRSVGVITGGGLCCGRGGLYLTDFTLLFTMTSLKIYL